MFPYHDAPKKKQELSGTLPTIVNPTAGTAKAPEQFTNKLNAKKLQLILQISKTCIHRGPCKNQRNAYTNYEYFETQTPIFESQITYRKPTTCDPKLGT
jgi:hypothetical protein